MIRTPMGPVNVVTSCRADGDFHPDRTPPAVLAVRRRSLVDLPWTMLDEEHGTEVVEVRWPGDGDGRSGDVLVTSATDAVLGVWVGDCAPVVLVSPTGRIAAVHAGWRGLAAGVLDVAVAALLGGSRSAASRSAVRAVLGPCIGPCCYEFGDEDRTAVARGVGAEPVAIRGTDRFGRPALDVPAAVRLGLARHRIALDLDTVCTGCDERFFSHRARSDSERQVVAVWRSAA